MKNNIIIKSLVSFITILALTQARGGFNPSFASISQDMMNRHGDMKKINNREEWKLCVDNHKNNTLDANVADFGAQKWWVFTDECKNGHSSANISESEDNSLVFQGNLLQGEIGFGYAEMSTVKQEEPLFNTNIKYINITVKGDGQKYIFKLQYSDDFFAPAWAQVFTAPEESTEVELLIENFKPFNWIANDTELDIQNVTILSIKLMNSDKQEHPRHERDEENGEHKKRGPKSEQGQEHQGRKQQRGEQGQENSGRKGQRSEQDQQPEFLKKDDGHVRRQRQSKEKRGDQQQKNHGRNAEEDFDSESDVHQQKKGFSKSNRTESNPNQRQGKHRNHQGEEQRQRRQGGQQQDQQNQGENKQGRNNKRQENGHGRNQEENFEQKRHGRKEHRKTKIAAGFMKNFFEETAGNQFDEFYLEIEKITVN